MQPSPSSGRRRHDALIANTLFWCSLLFAFSLVKLVFPAKRVRASIDPLLNAIATSWIAGNSGWMRLTQRAKWDVSGLEELDYRGWYMVNCNHQSWVDIFILQHLLNRRIPMLKFFLKQQLLYVPVMGLAWWALDFRSCVPLRRLPHNPPEALGTSKPRGGPARVRSCHQRDELPEGTLRGEAQAQRSPYRHLLKPKAEGAGAGSPCWATSSLAHRRHDRLQEARPRSGFLCGRMSRVDVRVRRLAIPPEFGTGDYALDARFRKTVQAWLQDLWHDKDRQIDALLDAARVRSGEPGDAGTRVLGHA
jgi:hypothetical protein